MQHTFISRSLQVLAAALSNSAAIELEISPKATTFSTNGRRILMPPLAVIEAKYPQAADLETYVIGAVVHESGHILRTDADLRKAFNRMFNGHIDGARAIYVGQVVEDVVIERYQCQNLAGGRSALTALWELLYKQYGVNDLHEGDLHDRAFRHIFLSARHSVIRKDWTLDFVTRSALALQEVMDAGAYQDFSHQLDLLHSIETTQEGFRVAMALLNELGIEPNLDGASEDEHTGKPAEAQPTEAEKGGNRQESEKGSDLEQSEAPQEPIEGGQGPQADEATGDQAGPSDEQEGKALAGEGESVEGDQFTALVSQAVMDINEALPEDTVYALYFGEGTFGGQALATEPVQSIQTSGAVLQHKVLMKSMFARQKLVTLLKAQTEARTEFTRSGVIVASRLWKLKAGNLKVFKKTIEGNALSTGIKILLDRSGSMSSEMQTAIEAAAFLPLAFDYVDGIKSSLDIFPGNTGYVQTVKPFETRTQSCMDLMASVSASGGTPMTEAIEISGGTLLDLNVDRRLLVVITDGEPYDKQAARSRVQSLTRHGVEVIGIGIGTGTRASMKAIFKDYCVIQKVDDLADELYQVMQRMLLPQLNAA